MSEMKALMEEQRRERKREGRIILGAIISTFSFFLLLFLLTFNLNILLMGIPFTLFAGAMGIFWGRKTSKKAELSEKIFKKLKEDLDYDINDEEFADMLLMARQRGFKIRNFGE